MLQEHKSEHSPGFQKGCLFQFRRFLKQTQVCIHRSEMIRSVVTLFRAEPKQSNKIFGLQVREVCSLPSYGSRVLTDIYSDFILKTVDHKQAVVEESKTHRRWRSFKQPQGEDQQQREEKQHLPTISRAPRETEKQDDSSFTRDGQKVAPHIFSIATESRG